MPGDSLLSGIFSNLRQSCFGSDELQAYTATYSWLSNQMSHAMMGFFLAIAFAWLPLPIPSERFSGARRLARRIKAGWEQYPWLRFVAPYLVPLVKLPFDVLMIWLSAHAFRIPWDDFWSDKLTDLNFWFLGMLLAQMAMIGSAGQVPGATTEVHGTLPNREPGSGWGSECRVERIVSWLLWPFAWLVLRLAHVTYGFLSLLPRLTRTLANALPTIGKRVVRVRRTLSDVVRAPLAALVLCYWLVFLSIPEWFWPCRRILCAIALVVAVFFGVRHYEYWTGQKATFDRSSLPSGWVRVFQFDTAEAFPERGQKGEALEGAALKQRRESRQQMEERTRAYLRFVETEKPGRMVHCVIRGGWPVNRTDLAIALGTEFAARRRAIYYFTASKLLEGPDELDRWQRLATEDGKGENLMETHPYFPRCVVIDDLPKVFPEPAPTPIDVSSNNPYDGKVNSQKIFNWFHKNRNRVSTIWVLTCEEAQARKWLDLIRDYACWEKQPGDGWSGVELETERNERVIDVDLGSPPPRRAIRRGP